ncbi:diguanylate cyclase [Helicobacter sp.]|uniref:GGDEF domain-containing protein n=1 Tax=Helicobacter sp. TaxID=218 RepID=UPI002A91DA42|nr:diguanylate cyclase [Helicobacter sp.]MDY5557184.1 diguanylate cyclase [Helicobacter sp.]
MQNIQSIAREALKELLKEGKEPTPEFYAEAFNAQAKKLGANVGEIDFSTSKILEMLNKEVRESLFHQKFKHKNELITALVHSINHLYFYKKNFYTQLEILKLLLRLVATHPNKEIASLAKGHLLVIDKLNAQSMQMWRERWINYIKEMADMDFVDLAKGLEILLGFKIDCTLFCQWQEKARLALKSNPSKDIKIKLMRDLETAFRVQFDKVEIPKNSVQSPPLKDSQAPQEQPLTFKDIASLPIDAVTTLMSKHGIEEVLDFAELEYQKNQKNYAVIVFGIAAYDKIKEQFGLEAAKRVLSTLGRLLKQHSNTSDLIAYYGEEEFLACLLERDKNAAIAFIRELDAIVRGSKFMFQQTRIDISLSAQASHRVEAKDLESMLKMSLEEFIKNKDSQGIIQCEI